MPHGNSISYARSRCAKSVVAIQNSTHESELSQSFFLLPLGTLLYVCYLRILCSTHCATKTSSPNVTKFSFLTKL